MKRYLLYSALAALTVLSIGASSSLAARNGDVAYQFNGRLLADAGNSSALSLDVKGGNHAALRKLVGQSESQQFTVDNKTEYLRWSNGVPTVVAESNLVAGDHVSVRIRAARDASLAEIEAAAAAVVSDRGSAPRLTQKPLWLFVGTLEAPAADGKLTLHVQNGNLVALRALLGQSVDQTFGYDAKTIFVLWQGRVPSVISPSQLKAGDRISVRIRAPRRDSLAQAEQVPANHVGDHEPGTKS